MKLAKTRTLETKVDEESRTITELRRVYREMLAGTPSEPEFIIPASERHKLYRLFPSPPITDTGGEG